MIYDNAISRLLKKNKNVKSFFFLPIISNLIFDLCLFFYFLNKLKKIKNILQKKTFIKKINK